VKHIRQALFATGIGLLVLGFIGGLVALAADVFKDRGACLADRIVPGYVYLSPVYTPGPNGTTTTNWFPAYMPETTECAAWEFPEGRP
jgi:hypothetical protein